MNIATIIPAAGRGSRMLSLTDNCPKSMIPVAGRPLIGYLLDQIVETGQKDVFIIVGYMKDVLIYYVNMMYADKLNIHYVEQSELLGLNHAIYTAIHTYDFSKYDGIYIMLGDSIFRNKNIYKFGDKSYIACMEVKDYSRWCIANVDDNNQVLYFDDKPSTPPLSNLAIVGAYYYSNPSAFIESVDKAINSNVKIRGEFQISTAMEFYMESEPIEVLKVDEDEWFDFGDLTTYNKNKKAFNQSRFFNNIEYRDDIVTKDSPFNYHKIQQEINWFLTLPKPLSKYVATLVDYSLNDSDVYYSMPYCDGVTLQELWLYSNLSEEEWVKIIANLKNVLNDFKEYSNIYHRTDIVKFLEDNIKKRVDVDKVFGDTNKYIINDIEHKSLAELKDYFFKKLHDLKSADFNRIIHGDMVFSNILYDIVTGKVTMIDPRGNFNGDIIYGDVRYDLAKIAQCVLGDYDYIVNNLFTLHDDGDHNVSYTFYNDKPMFRKLALVDILLTGLDAKYSDVLFITAVQFLTMIPLHAENADHQRLMYIKFIELLNAAERLDNK